MIRRRKHPEEPHQSGSRGAKLLKANRARGMCAATPGYLYATDRSKDKPNSLQGTRGGKRK